MALGFADPTCSGEFFEIDASKGRLYSLFLW